MEKLLQKMNNIRKLILFTIFFLIPYGLFPQNKSIILSGGNKVIDKNGVLLNFTPSVPVPPTNQIIADHTIVDDYALIPQQYIDSVKKMLVNMGGESHAFGYQYGCNLLEKLDSRFQVTTFSYSQSVPAVSSSYLRIGSRGVVGEANFYTNTSGIAGMESGITNQYNAGNPISVMGFAWCVDMTWHNAPGGTIDPVYNVHWAGSSEGGPEGDLRWGLDAADKALTGNSVCMDTYLNAVNTYNAYCMANGYRTRCIFTTGPVESEEYLATENGFQRELKHDYIRNYVLAGGSRILFDYADILCHNNNGIKYTSDWNDGGTIRSFAQIHPDNQYDYDASWNIIPWYPWTDESPENDHIGEVGALRLGKAM
jgi:hypothetical protein